MRSSSYVEVLPVLGCGRPGVFPSGDGVGGVKVLVVLYCICTSVFPVLLSVV